MKEKRVLKSPSYLGVRRWRVDVERVAPAVLRRCIARSRRVALRLGVMARGSPAAQLAAFLPQRTGAQQRQHNRQQEAPKVPVVNEEQIQHVVRRGSGRPGSTGRRVQITASLGTTFLRREAPMTTFAKTGRHLEREMCIHQMTEAEYGWIGGAII